MRCLFAISLILCTLFVGVAFAEPVGTGFTYQGELTQSGVPASGVYDFEFNLFHVEVNGVPVTGPVQLEDIDVLNGVFSVELDFGAEPYTGEQLWLEIWVREGDSVGAFTPLFPRQKLTSTPYALESRVAELEAQIAELQGLVATLQSNVSTNSANISGNSSNIATNGATISSNSSEIANNSNKLQFVSIEHGDLNNLTGPHVILEGANVHIRSGSGSSTDGCNIHNPCPGLTGRGNLIIGYNAGGGTRTGSHNIISGDEHSFAAVGGVISGVGNITERNYATILSGQSNRIVAKTLSNGSISSPSFSSIISSTNVEVTRYRNIALGSNTSTSDGKWSVMIGGEANRISETASMSVHVGGLANQIEVWNSVIVGGNGNLTTDTLNETNDYGAHSLILGGRYNSASGTFATVVGGQRNSAFGGSTTVVGSFDQALDEQNECDSLLGDYYFESGQYIFRTDATATIDCRPIPEQ